MAVSRNFKAVAFATAANLAGYVACLLFGPSAPRTLMIVLVLLLPLASGALAAGIADSAPAKRGATAGFLATLLSLALVTAFGASPSAVTAVAWLLGATVLGWLGAWLWGRRAGL